MTERRHRMRSAAKRMAARERMAAAEGMSAGERVSASSAAERMASSHMAASAPVPTAAMRRQHDRTTQYRDRDAGQTGPDALKHVSLLKKIGPIRPAKLPPQFSTQAALGSFRRRFWHFYYSPLSASCEETLRGINPA